MNNVQVHLINFLCFCLHRQGQCGPEDLSFVLLHRHPVRIKRANCKKQNMPSLQGPSSSPTTEKKKTIPCFLFVAVEALSVPFDSFDHKQQTKYCIFYFIFADDILRRTCTSSLPKMTTIWIHLLFLQLLRTQTEGILNWESLEAQQWTSMQINSSCCFILHSTCSDYLLVLNMYIR